MREKMISIFYDGTSDIMYGIFGQKSPAKGLEPSTINLKG